MPLASTRRAFLALAPALAATASGRASAQAYPARPIRLVVPTSAGAGVTDIMARLVGQKLGESLGQQVVIDNRPGASGILGSEVVAKAPSDGYTLLIANVSLIVNPYLFAKMPYDPLADFVPVTMVNTAPQQLVVHPSVPAASVAELVAYAKTRPGQLNYGSGGLGSTPFLAAELFKSITGIDVVHVPYKGAAQAMTDLMGGQINAVSTTLSTAAGQIKGGRARALALSSAERLPDYADIPTFVEQGYPDLVATVWFSLSGPAGIPPEIADKLNAEVRRALETSDVRARMRHDGIVPNRLDVKEFTAFVADELRRWGPIVRASGAKNE